MPLAEPSGVYRPRHPERTVVYRLFEEHFERYVREYGPARPVGPHENPEPSASPSRANWARLLRRIFEVDPLICAACGTEMKIVSVITQTDVIHAILRHRARTGGRDPFEGRAPPAA